MNRTKLAAIAKRRLRLPRESVQLVRTIYSCRECPYFVDKDSIDPERFMGWFPMHECKKGGSPSLVSPERSIAKDCPLRKET